MEKTIAGYGISGLEIIPSNKSDKNIYRSDENICLICRFNDSIPACLRNDVEMHTLEEIYNAGKKK